MYKVLWGTAYTNLNKSLCVNRCSASAFNDLLCNMQAATELAGSRQNIAEQGAEYARLTALHKAESDRADRAAQEVILHPFASGLDSMWIC